MDGILRALVIPDAMAPHGDWAFAITMTTRYAHANVRTSASLLITSRKNTVECLYNTAYKIKVMILYTATAMAYMG